ncbi:MULTISPECIES: putative DNA-binding protein [unclassified Granulicatella]|uniref:putative DNA-binding protein n=1 Tax=unclassified Granulicatella TaxID=2630493 RepID=UPI00107317BE|nr:MULTISPECIES: putative DNA-binding protein [unclassified Granulicatella]MBF0780256.1 putative DNA-binding protein [Granulicatella sp. 19428wC4_WM01]TFU95637.1 putative DNA-binding protein [Granulicatella sp. WM01]
MEIEKTLYMTHLYDFYGNLLTDKQKDYLELYYEQDLSLTEISQELAVSRQAVYDNIKRSEAILLTYEKTLQLVEQFQSRQKAIEQLESYASRMYADDVKLMDLIKNIENGEE